jgi:hypothetical protein
MCEMPIHVFWDEQIPNLIWWRFETPWNWREYVNAHAASDALLNAHATDLVDTISDLRQGKLIPADLLTYARRYMTPQNTHPLSSRFTVVIGADMWLKSLLNIFVPRYVKHWQMAFVEHETELYAAVERERQRRTQIGLLYAD